MKNRSRGSKCNPCGDNNKSLLSRLNKRIVIYKVDNSQTSTFGSTVPILIPVANVWAAVEPLRGREFFSSFAEHAEVTTRIRIRYRKGIDRTMVVKCDGVEFEVLHIIDPEFKHEELQLMSKERQ